jgi:hypothetical protein
MMPGQVRIWERPIVAPAVTDQAPVTSMDTTVPAARPRVTRISRKPRPPR